MVVPAKVMVTGCELAKPVPLMLIEDPSVPLVGLKEIDGMTAKLAVGEL